MRRMLLVALTAGVTACRHEPPASEPPALTADSLSLERTRCFGFCPTYRVSLDAAGIVRFVSHNPGDSTRATDTLSPTAFRGLLDEARRARLRTLPAEIVRDRSLCPTHATDQSSVIVTLFLRDTVVRIVDYLGCYANTEVLSVPPALAPLRAFEARMERVTGSARWAKPASGKG